LVEKISPVFGASVRTLCDTGTVTFTDSTKTIGSISRTWYFGDGQTSTLQNPTHKYTAAGSYNVKLVVQSSFGCADSVTYNGFIKVVKSPSISIVVNDTICEGTTTFAAQLAADTSKIVSWIWSFGNGNTSLLQSPDLQRFSAGAYQNSVSVTNTSGCQSSVVKPLTVIGLPVLQLTNDTTICESSPTPLRVSGANTYTWTSSSPATLSCTNCASPVITTAANTLYKVTGVASSGCSSVDSVLVRVQPKYTLSATPDVSVCIGSSVQLNATGAPNYMWSPSTGLTAVNIPNPKASPTATTTYTVIGYDSVGCFTDTATVTATVFNYPTVSLGADSTISIGNPLTLNSIVSNDVVSYRWIPTTDLSCSNCPNPTLVTRQDMLYRLLVTNIGGCVAEDSIRIIVTCNNSSVFVPNTFSPNGDGMNDVFYPRGKGIFSIRNIKIFNRWGESVFEKRDFAPNDPSSGWTGMFKGQKAETGVYTYYIEIVCNSSQVIKYFGNINLIQ
jgi:gliding motility-associated-like protein